MTPEDPEPSGPDGGDGPGEDGAAGRLPGQVPGQGWAPPEENLAGTGPAGPPRVPGQAPAGFGGVTSAAAAPEVPAGGAAPAVPAPADPIDGELPPSDAELTVRVRGGDDAAYEELYRRHADAVRRYARTCCRDGFTAEDLAAEVFTRTLQALRAGRGPQLAVRAYLLTAVRNVAAAWTHGERREHLVDDFTALLSSSALRERLDITDPGADVWALAAADRRTVLRAFVALPEEDRVVLWHTEVERESPRQVAVLLGRTANATAVQAHRARERLAAAFLRAHLSSVRDDGCRRHADRLGAYARGTLRKRASAEVGAHLRECDDCSAAFRELSDLTAGLRAALPGGVLVWVGAGYFTAAATALAGGPAAADGAVGGSRAGAGAHRGAARGMGAAAKAAFAATAVAAAGAIVASTLSGGTAPHRPPQALPQPVVSRPVPSPEPHRTGPGPEPGRTVTPTPPSEGPAAHSAPPPPARPLPSASRADAPPEPPPPSTPTPTPTPRPVHTPPPAPHTGPDQGYWLDQLGYGTFGPGPQPTVRGSADGWLWQRRHLGIDGAHHAHGVTMGAPSAVTIDLDRGCSSFDALAGVDDLTQGFGSVVLSVEGGDGRTLWSSGPVRGGDAALPVHVPLTGQRAMRLLVRPAQGDPLPVLDVADWAQARLACGGGGEPWRPWQS